LRAQAVISAYGRDGRVDILNHVVYILDEPHGNLFRGFVQLFVRAPAYVPAEG